MTFAAPLGLLALVAIPAIVAIHLFRRRFPVRPVAGLFLWQVPRARPEGGGRITRLPVTRSLLLECLAALALALLCAGARVSPAAISRHLVVLLDDAASMGAVNAAGESARDRAVGRVLAEIDRLGSGARVTIVRSGDRPSILVGPAARTIEARTALAAWTPVSPHHSLALGLRLARELAGQTGEVMVVSNVAPDVRGEASFTGGLWVAVGEPAANVGVISADRARDPDTGRGTVSLTLLSNAGQPVRRQVSVSAAGTVLLTRDLDVPSGSSSLTLPLPEGVATVRVALSDDALARDNAVVLAEPEPQTVAVEDHLPEGRGRTALEKAFDALSGVTRAASGHLAFGDAAALDRPGAPGVWRVGFGRPPASWIGAGEARDFLGPFVMEKRHPMLLGVTLQGVVWAGALPTLPGPLHPLVSTADRVLAGAASMSGPAGSGTSILFNLDLDRTNLVRSPDWPILISNLVELRRQGLPGPERWNYRSGEWVRVRLGHDPTAPLHYRCGGADHALPAMRQVEFIAPSPGGLLQILEGDRVLFEIGVNFLDEIESSLHQPFTGDTGRLADAPGLRAESGASSDPLFWILLAVAAAALLTNWGLLAPHRGTRPASWRPRG